MLFHVYLSLKHGETMLMLTCLDINELHMIKELCANHLISFFNELDSRKGTLLMGKCLIFQWAWH